MIIECKDCGELFDQRAMRVRNAEPEDGVPFYQRAVGMCPVCGSTALQDAAECMCCGRPVREEEEELCDECAHKVDLALVYAATLLTATWKDLPLGYAIELLARRADEVNAEKIKEELDND